MKVFVDGAALEIPSGEGKERLLEEVRRFCASRGRVMQTLAVDGIALEEEVFLTLEGGSLVEFTTTPLRDLIRSSLEEAVTYLPRLTRGLCTVADHLEAEEKGAGLSLLSDALEGIGWLLKVLADTDSLLGGRARDGDDLPPLLTDLQSRLEELARSLEEGRFFEAAHHMRERLVPALGRLAPRIEALQSLADGDVH